ncbi:hypothetical protein [Paraburkholderia lacunae]|uniref:hypothetical protein n=1 Tax=Paraburkholderia lacunae TaxID=2211104 RepID=UPI001AD842F5|nr:hypothetical protein [Paraburkholderia lacunae]
MRKADPVSSKEIGLRSLRIQWSTNLSRPLLNFRVLLPFHSLAGRSRRRKNDGLAVGNVPHAAHEPVLLIIRGYPVETQLRQCQHFLCLKGGHYAVIRQIFKCPGRVADINAAHLSANSHQYHAFAFVERQFEIAGKRS